MKVNALGITGVADASLSSERSDKMGAGDAFATLFAAAERSSRPEGATKPSSRAVEATDRRSDRRQSDRIDADARKPAAARGQDDVVAATDATDAADEADRLDAAADAAPVEAAVDEADDATVDDAGIDAASAAAEAPLLAYSASSVAIDRATADADATDDASASDGSEEPSRRLVTTQQPAAARAPAVQEAVDAEASEDADADRATTAKAEPAKPLASMLPDAKAEAVKAPAVDERAVVDRPAPPPQVTAQPQATVDDIASQDPARPQPRAQSDSGDANRQAKQQSQGQPDERVETSVPQVRVGAEPTEAVEDPSKAEKPLATTHAATGSAGQTAPTDPAANATATAAHAATPAPQAGAPAAPAPAAPASASTGGEAATQQPMNDADSSRVADQAMRGLRGALMQRGGSVTLRLNPAELGELKIQVQLSGGAVRAQIEAGNEGTRSMLQQHLSSLRAALTSHGLTVEQLNITAAAASQHSASNSGDDPRNAADDGRSRGSFDRGGDEHGGGRRDGEAHDARDPRSFNKRLLDLVA